MLLFPIIYISSFLYSLVSLFKKKVSGIFLFLVFGLPIYTTALSVSYTSGLGKMLPLLQSFKEILILSALGYLLYYFSRKFVWHLIDKLIVVFFLYSLLYIILPIGQYGPIDKILAFKSLSFFALIYLAGRLFDPRKLFINQFFHYICLITVAATVLLLYEVWHYQHFQTMTGYADYNYYIFNQDPSGDYGLSWTFQTDSGLKRFASFFSNPLEQSAATLLTVSVLAGLYTQNNNRIKPDTFGWIVLGCTFVAIVYSLSRASFVSYFLMIYIYAFLTKKKYILWFIHGSFIAALIYFFFFIDKELEEFIIDTINFNNPSSLGHLLEWLDGIQAMITKPLGMGLGESGKVSNALGQNVGGENQFIVVGVQIGVIGLAIYTAIYFLLIKNAYKWFKRLQGKEKKVCLAILLMKIGFLVPMMTSNFESYIYISYITWFLSGLFVTMISGEKKSGNVKADIAAVTVAR